MAKRRFVCESGYTTRAQAEREARTLRRKGRVAEVRTVRARVLPEFKVCWQKRK